MPEESAGHVSEEPLPHTLGTAFAVSLIAQGPLQKPVCQRSLHRLCFFFSAQGDRAGVVLQGRPLFGVAKKLFFRPLFFSLILCH